ncbi:MAG TPA: hypothetical protein VKG44_11465 [Candidatus Baltobacteraceae bacterium]|nr:hypothetical protein [Candidatus Baltobacteraceae bacterium]
MTRERLIAELEGAGFTVHYAAGGDAGLALVRERSPNATVLLDGSESLGGISLLQAVRHVSQGPVILLDARSEAAAGIVGVARGAADFGARHDELSALLGRIRDALRPSLSAQVAGAARALVARVRKAA